MYSLKVVTYHHNNEEIYACAGGPNYELLVDEIWPWVDIMLYSCLPFLIICVLNVHIIRQVGQTFHFVISCVLKEVADPGIWKLSAPNPCPTHYTYGTCEMTSFFNTSSSQNIKVQHEYDRNITRFHYLVSF